MNTDKPIWLASFPRSGNTYLRTILWHCFGLRSASIYPHDLAGKRKLEDYVGHIEKSPDNIVQFPQGNLPLFKTHEYMEDNSPAIYVVRDGRAASVSIWNFYNKETPLQTIIEGDHRFGTWSAHVKSWQPWARENTLLLKYEDIVSDLPGVLGSLSEYLSREIVSQEIPDRNTIADADGRWVRQKSDWRDDFSASLLERFDEINGDMMEKLGYLD